jgi:acyl-CoA thioester hydrolase
MDARTELRVRYSETDAMGVVHHSCFLSWFEVGRTELMREAGYAYTEMEKDGITMPVVEARCRYHSPARYDDRITVETHLEEITRVTTRFSYRVGRTSDGTLLASGSTLHAAVDGRGVPRRLPERLVAVFSAAGRA